VLLTVVVLVCISYLGLLFLVAGQVERRPAWGARVSSSATVYALSLGVYATAWTFFGSIGMAAESGNLFLAVYIGPTLAAILFVPVLGRIVRIARRERIHSIADFMSARYGKSDRVGIVVSLIALVGLTPYLAVQLKAITHGLEFLAAPRAVGVSHSMFTLAVALLLALFVLVFGTRQLDLTKHRRALVTVVALESAVKLAAFILVGLAVTFVLFPGPRALFAQAAENAVLAPLLSFGPDREAALSEWPWVVLVSALVVICLPRMFQMAVVENNRESHVRVASWMFPLYLLGFTLFTLAIALAGRLLLPEAVSPDVYVLALPQHIGSGPLVVLAFLGGFSAATAMLIVETLALANMLTHQLALPLLMRIPGWQERVDLSRVLVQLRRATVIVGLLLAWAYEESLGEMGTLVNIGLVSFLAIAQFAPALFVGLFWSGATRAGALAGLLSGFIVWLYTMVLPLAAGAGLLPGGLVADGPFGIEWLRPVALFGVDMPPFAHGAYWSLLLNSALVLAVSLLRPRPDEQRQAHRFLYDVPSFRQSTLLEPRRSAPYGLLVRVLGAGEAGRALQWFERMAEAGLMRRLPDFPQYVESRIAAVVGSAAAKMMMAQAEPQDPLRDTVTGLPNRAAVVGEIADRLATARDPATLLIAALRIDRHRLVATGIGEDMSELLIRRIGLRLQSGLHEDELLTRSGVDTFAVVMSPSQEFGTACRRMAELQATIAPVFDLRGRLVSSTSSVGIARGRPGVNAGALLREAETALEATASPPGNCRLFEPAMRESMLESVEFEARLRQARERGELEVKYQPVVALSNRRLVGFESLLRWHPERDSVVSPNRFIPVLESTGLILNVGDFVLEQACRKLDEWQCATRQRKAHLSVNVSARQLSEPDFPKQLESLMEMHGVGPDCLWIEITETTLMEHPERAHRTLVQLKLLGVKILLDDFGTGYSSLAYLQRFPIDTLKIDQTFIRRYGPRSSPLAEAGVAIAKKLGLSVVAEGVETRVQYEWLRDLGVEYGQGYYFSPPVSIDEAEAILSGARALSGPGHV
jgi:EAL domain-containing protein (putative c-di-GMP-specific phosphodiesterase class I)/Na+/proline symporter/GGDEF domain-containing protein